MHKRLKALGRMGATVTLAPPHRMPLRLQLLIAIAGIVVAVLPRVVLYLLVMVSIALSGIFTMLPTMILHAILR